MRHEKSAGVIVYFFDKEIKFLLLKYKTYWGFAKGLMEKGESEEQTALRELKEETNLNAELIPGFKKEQRWFYTLNKESVSKKAVFFLAKVSKQEAEKTKISFEHEDFSWLNLEDAKKKIKIKNNREMIEKAYEFIVENDKQKKLF